MFFNFFSQIFFLRISPGFGDFSCGLLIFIDLFIYQEDKNRYVLRELSLAK